MHRNGDKKRVEGKRRLVQYDRLHKESQTEKVSLWQGEHGTYCFEPTGVVEAKKPIRKVYLNRTYLTGLFRSRKPQEFLGDLKEPEGKKYLLFRLVDSENMVIYQKV